MRTTLNSGFKKARHEVSAHESGAHDILRGATNLFQLKNAVTFSLTELNLSSQESAHLRTTMSKIFAPKGAPTLPLAQMKERTHALVTYLRSTVSDEALECGLTYVGRMTPEFKTTTQRSWEKIPSPFRSLLLNETFSIVASETALSAFPDYLDVTLGQDEDDPRSHVTQLPGLFNALNTKACASQFFLSNKSDPKMVGYCPTPESILLGHWNVSGLPSRAIAHESAHGLDKVMVRYIGAWLSHTKAFKRAYKADIKAMGGFEAARDKDYKYYVRKNEDTSRQETFAELQSHQWGGIKGHKMATDFTHCNDYIVTFNKTFVKAHRAGLTSFMHFASTLEPVKDGQFSPTLLTKWTQLLRSKPNLTETDVRGWADAVPPSKMIVLAKNYFKMGATAPNDKAIVEHLVGHEVRAMLSPKNIAAGYESHLMALSSIPAFQTMLAQQALALNQKQTSPVRSAKLTPARRAASALTR